MFKQRITTRTLKRAGAVLAAIAGLGAWLQLSGALATPPGPEAPATLPAAQAAPAQQPAQGEPADPAVPQVTGANATAEPDTARIVFTTVPATNATVTWGRQRLGRIAPRKPLVVTRPRDSGPLDVIVSAPGFLPVHTRAHTFTDTRVHVKLTRPEEKHTLLGYREPLDAGVPLTDENGLPLTSEASPTLTDSPLSNTVMAPLAQPQPAPQQPQPQPLPPAVAP